MSNILKEKIFSNPFFTDVMNSVSDAIFIYDDTGCTVFMNRAAQQYENMKLEDALGRHINDLYMQDYSPSLKALETCKPVTDPRNTYIINGKECIQDTRAYPVFDNDTLIGVYTIERDLTSIKHMVDESISYQKKMSNKKISFDTLVGSDEQFLKCVELGRIAAKNDSSVMLSGYTGTGKEMFAKSIHNASSRRDNSFLAINCAAIPETLLESILFGTTKGSFTGAAEKPGLFEEAKGGTVFLDEINSMPLASQAKILRVIEEKECMRVGGSKSIKIDVRIISSINVTPQEALEKGQLRSDLFFRLSVVNIIIPPLSARKNDIMLLCRFFIDSFNSKLGRRITAIDEKTQSFITDYSWPGNVRQLKHTIESAMSMTDEADTVLTFDMLPQYLLSDSAQSDQIFRASEPHSSSDSTAYAGSANSSSNVFEAIRDSEKEKIINMLYACNGNVSKAARELQMNRQSLIYKMKKYGIERKK